jgi:GNAT superfamily N-acetyltransferase
MAHLVRAISAAETRLLRQRVLRPAQRIEELVYPGDAAPDTLHLGAFLGDALVGVASVSREAPPGDSSPRAWRLRGMAALPELRRQGIGAALLRACLAHVREQGGDLLWCHARSGAVPFYRALELAESGEEFELPGLGPHWFMSRRV